ncbi:hypothetical protein AKJ09_10221 [Labilithrix luteola]|uniref:Uncharacterized protein n=1 Tax=Labilithrix luteola TaxID=1391654 RepID=A0A0K1QCV2_9BACT|nr:hypothetical protein AKJ09_10221 [Labilithrix luteola]
MSNDTRWSGIIDGLTRCGGRPRRVHRTEARAARCASDDEQTHENKPGRSAHAPVSSRNSSTRTAARCPGACVIQGPIWRSKAELVGKKIKRTQLSMRIDRVCGHGCVSGMRSAVPRRRRPHPLDGASPTAEWMRRASVDRADATASPDARARHANVTCRLAAHRTHAALTATRHVTPEVRQ